MNKFYKFIAMFIAIFAFTAYVNAQTWTAPAYVGSVPVSGTTYFIYNVGSNGFLNRGGEWAAHAVVTSKPIGNAATNVVRWTPVNTTGSTWTFQYNSNGSNVANNYLFPSDVTGGWLFTDNSTNNTWTLTQTDAVNNLYSIQINSSYGGYNATQYMGSSATTETTNKGIANPVRYNRAGGDNYTLWKFISQADYDLYNAKVLLDRYMNYAKLKGGIDLTSYIATYNAGVTADINNAAATLLTALGRVDVTASILNPSFETNTFANWTNSGSFALQSNSPGIWTKAGTYYAEKYTGSGGNLGAGTITQTITGLANGLYGLTASGHAVQQAGANPMHTGAFFTAGPASTEVISGGNYSVDYIPVIDGTLTIGYKLQAPVACNWTGFDNFQLYYYGTMAVPSMTATETSLFFNGGTTSKGFNVLGANLTANINITAPAGITLSGTNLVNNGGGSYTILAANANASNAITATWDGLASTAGVNITIAESEVTTVNVSVETSADAACFTPLYPTLTNLITDPYMTDLSKFGGWGNKTIVINPAEAYCGSRYAFINGTATCYPTSGSIDANIAWLPNHTYKIKAMVKAINGTMNLGVSNEANVSGGSDFVVPQSTTWTEFTKQITTGPSATSGLCFFNGCGSSTGFIGSIDNWEIYDITSLITENLNPKDNLVNVFVRDNKIVVSLNVVNVENAEASVYSVNGMLLSTQKLNLTSGITEKQLNANLPAGAYVVKVVTDGKSYTQKVIK